MENNLIVDIVGWLGVGLLLLAYGLVSMRRVLGDSLAYQSLNLIGSALLIVNSFYYGAFPSVGVNLAWIGIAGLTLAKRQIRPNRTQAVSMEGKAEWPEPKN